MLSGNREVTGDVEIRRQAWLQCFIAQGRRKTQKLDVSRTATFRAPSLREDTQPAKRTWQETFDDAAAIFTIFVGLDGMTQQTSGGGGSFS